MLLYFWNRTRMVLVHCFCIIPSQEQSVSTRVDRELLMFFSWKSWRQTCDVTLTQERARRSWYKTFSWWKKWNFFSLKQASERANRRWRYPYPTTNKSFSFFVPSCSCSSLVFYLVLRYNLLYEVGLPRYVSAAASWLAGDEPHLYATMRSQSGKHAAAAAAALVLNFAFNHLIYLSLSFWLKIHSYSRLPAENKIQVKAQWVFN